MRTLDEEMGLTRRTEDTALKEDFCRVRRRAVVLSMLEVDGREQRERLEGSVECLHWLWVLSSSEGGTNILLSTSESVVIDLLFVVIDLLFCSVCLVDHLESVRPRTVRNLSDRGCYTQNAIDPHGSWSARS